jgi:hypothetical protein
MHLHPLINILRKVIFNVIILGESFNENFRIKIAIEEYACSKFFFENNITENQLNQNGNLFLVYYIILDEFHYHIVVDHLFQMIDDYPPFVDFFLNVLADFETKPKHKTFLN